MKYKLFCKNCNYCFDSWFASSNEYEKLKKKKYLNCYICGSSKIEKTLMSPNILKNENKKYVNLQNDKFNNIKKTINEYQKFIKENFKFVGENFSHEARSIHYSKKKKLKNIYGTATKKDLRELEEEGIEIGVVPWFEDKNN
jgi:hypothetical protein